MSVVQSLYEGALFQFFRYLLPLHGSKRVQQGELIKQTARYRGGLLIIALATWSPIRRRASFAGTKNCGGEKKSGESEGGQKFLPPQPPSFLPARAFRFCARSAQSFGVLLKKCSNFVQKTLYDHHGFSKPFDILKPSSDSIPSPDGFC